MPRPTRHPDPAAPVLSSAVIDQRLREVAQLYTLGVALQEARRLGPVLEDATAGASEPPSLSI